MRKRTRIVLHSRPLAPGARELVVNGRAHALVALGDAIHGELFWMQPAVFRREWQLVSERGEHMLIHGRGLSGRRASVETPAATWSVSRGWTGRVELTDAGGGSLMSVAHRWLMRSRLEPAAGPSLVWRWHWSGGRTLEDEEGQVLLRLQRVWSFLRQQAVVTVADAARGREDLLQLLAVTGFAWLSEARSHAH